MGNSGSMRADDGEGLLVGYVTGPAAATEATVMALARAASRGNKAKIRSIVHGAAAPLRDRKSVV